jgi:hypothetical protein
MARWIGSISSSSENEVTRQTLSVWPHAGALCPAALSSDHPARSRGSLYDLDGLGMQQPEAPGPLCALASLSGRLGLNP